jgi:hypothetical protein
MLKLDRKANDTSLALDLLRAVAAQMVCVGHAINFGGVGYLGSSGRCAIVLYPFRLRYRPHA